MDYRTMLDERDGLPWLNLTGYRSIRDTILAGVQSGLSTTWFTDDRDELDRIIFPLRPSGKDWLDLVFDVLVNEATGQPYLQVMLCVHRPDGPPYGPEDALERWTMFQHGAEMPGRTGYYRAIRLVRSASRLGEVDLSVTHAAVAELPRTWQTEDAPSLAGDIVRVTREYAAAA